MNETDRRPLLIASLSIGAGMGGFADGIALHQILQLHNMLSARLPPTDMASMQANMAFDGWFHAGTWIFTAIGIALLVRALKRRPLAGGGRSVLGGALAGWGLFNLIEGLIDHHLLHLHHVVERLGLSVWDYAYLGSGVLLIAAGWALVRSDRPGE